MNGSDDSDVVDVLRGTKQKRHCDGYEDGDTTLRKVCSAANFIWSDSPREILSSVTFITFENPACLPIKDHTLTTEEIKALCDDPRAYGNQDSNHLLKWRMRIRKALSPSEKATSVTTPAENDSNEDEDEKLLNEMEELTNSTEQKKKKAKELLAKRQAKGKKDLAAVDNDEYNDEIGSSDSEGGNEEAQGDTSNDAYTDDKSQRQLFYK
ncbi:FtsJ-like methyltransferase family protein [Forsythia ovata]|uniref:FtsJ-like methyltransferase family protein n=1 Tax=Forsythia ovata TaxID=205694 RepID=A0ABD1VJP0_9LAMI